MKPSAASPNATMNRITDAVRTAFAMASVDSS
jgi:hypothetical protein